MSQYIGNKLEITVFGQSHAPSIGVTIDGLPEGLKIDFDAVQAFLDRRAPGKNPWSTPRKEADVPEFISGLKGNVTCGAPLCAIIRNTNTRSKDYGNLATVPRPSHADFAAMQKYKESYDPAGGGQFSGRMTAPLCIAGAICNGILAAKGITVGSHILSIGNVQEKNFDPVAIDAATLNTVKAKSFATLDDELGQAMIDNVLAAKAEGDSVGGVVECAAVGLPAGVGETFFDSLESRLSQVVFAIPAVKGIEFGAGFGYAALKGSQANDPFCMTEGGKVQTATNRHGGILGGLTSGMPLVFRAAFKPTPSISKPQQSVDLATGQIVELKIEGRHDPCIVPRAAVAVEAATAIVLADLLL